MALNIRAKCALIAYKLRLFADFCSGFAALLTWIRDSLAETPRLRLVDQSARVSENAVAPANAHKPPDILCCTLGHTHPILREVAGQRYLGPFDQSQHIVPRRSPSLKQCP